MSRHNVSEADAPEMLAQMALAIRRGHSTLLWRQAQHSMIEVHHNGMPFYVVWERAAERIITVLQDVPDFYTEWQDYKPAGRMPWERSRHSIERTPGKRRQRNAQGRSWPAG